MDIRRHNADDPDHRKASANMTVHVDTGTETVSAPCDLDWLRTTNKAALSRNEVAQVMGVDPRTVTRSVGLGELPSVRIGRRTLIPTAALRRLLGITE